MSMDAQDVHSQVMDGDPDDVQVYCHKCEGSGRDERDFSCKPCAGDGWVYKWQYQGAFPATRWP